MWPKNGFAFFFLSSPEERGDRVPSFRHQNRQGISNFIDGCVSKCGVLELGPVSSRISPINGDSRLGKTSEVHLVPNIDTNSSHITVSYIELIQILVITV